MRHNIGEIIASSFSFPLLCHSLTQMGIYVVLFLFKEGICSLSSISHKLSFSLSRIKSSSFQTTPTSAVHP